MLASDQMRPFSTHIDLLKELHSAMLAKMRCIHVIRFPEALLLGDLRHPEYYPKRKVT